MQRTLGIAGAIGAVVIGLLVLAAVFVRWLVPEERVRGLVVQSLESSLDQDVSVGSAGVSLLPRPGVSLDNLVIGERPEPGKPQITVESIDLGARLLPLLQRRLVITRVEIVNPRVLAVLSDERTRAAEGTEPAATSPLAIQVESLRIRNGSVDVRLPDGTPLIRLGGISEDLRAGISREGEIRLRGTTRVDTLRFHMAAGTFGEGLRPRLEKSLVFDRAADRLSIDEAVLELAGLPVRISGAVHAVTSDDPALDLRLEGGPGRIEEIAAFIPAAFVPEGGGVKSSGSLRAEGFVRGPADDADFRVRLELRDGRLEHPELPAPVDDILVDLTVTPETIDVSRFAARTQAGRIDGSAALSAYQTRPHLRAAIDADLQLAPLTGLAVSADSLQLDGHAAADLRIEGAPGNPQSLRAFGTIHFENVAATGLAMAVPVNGAGGRVRLDGERLHLEGVEATVGGSPVRLQGFVHDWSALAVPPAAPPQAAVRPRVDLEVRSPRLDLGPFVREPSAGTTGGDGSEGAAIALPYDGRIALATSELVFREWTARDLQAVLLMSPDLLRLDRLVMGIFGGTIEAAGSIRLGAPPQYDLVAEARQLQASELFAKAEVWNRFAQLAGHITGALNATTSLSGSLTEQLALDPQTLTTTGQLGILQAGLEGYPVQTRIADFLDAPELRRLRIDEWQQSFRIDDGRLWIDRLRLESEGIEALVEGWQALDGAVRLDVDLLLPTSYSAKIRARVPSDVAALLTGSGDRVLVPLLVQGDIASASVTIDASQMTDALKTGARQKLEDEQQRLEEEARRRAEEAIRNLPFLGGGADSANADSARTPGDAVEEEIKKRLRGIFK